MWSEKYRPQNIFDMVGNEDARKQFVEWFGKWKKGTKPLLLIGPPGIGKTTMCFLAGKQFGYTIPKTILKKLTKRWAFFDKSYKIPQIRKDLKKQPKFLDWVMNTDKVDHKNMVKKNMLPFEKIFFSVGADILQNLSNFIAANPTKAVEKIRKDILKASNKVRAGGDIKKMKTLKQQLEKLNSIGGLKKIVPVEGVVFKYKGKTYKFTGAFAPVNQILGLVSF